MWIAALRSGKYQQVSGVLRRGDCYCGLGVLADVMGCKWSLLSAEDDCFVANFAPHGTGLHILPTDVQDSIDLPTLLMLQVAGMNDMGCWTFAKMADYLEGRA